MSRSSSSIHSYHSSQDWPSQSQLRPTRERTPDHGGEEVEQVVTTLLRTTKTLLEALTKWSQQLKPREEIEDIYNDLERQFMLVYQAFEEAGVEMSDLSWIPEQLKTSVDDAMVEKAIPASLDHHLPRIRDVIVHLLHGLKRKQQLLRDQFKVNRSSSTSINSGIGLVAGNASYYGDRPPSSRGSSYNQPSRPESRVTQSDYDPRASSMPQPQPSASYESSTGSNETLERRLKNTDDLKKRSSVRRTSIYNSKAFKISKNTPPVPLLHAHTETASSENKVADEDEEKKTGLVLFLQISDDVKKVSYAGEISISALSMLFVETFGYSSRQNDFPSIYIRDPQAGISYQLEDMAEVINKSVLSLHSSDKAGEAETEEQKNKREEEENAKRERWVEEIKNVFSKELSETREMLSNRIDEIKQEATQTRVAEPPREIQKELRLPPPPRSPIPQLPKSLPQAAPTGQNLSPKIAHSQLIEVRELRQELLVIRQIQREMHEGSGEVIEALRKKATELQTKTESHLPSTAQQAIEGSREKLLNDSDKITERLEKLQDTIDELKHDLTRRKCHPGEVTMRHCRDERKKLSENIEAFGKYIASVKPVWKETWERELQTILKDQTILKEQEGLLHDMKEDLEVLGEVFDDIEKFCASQAKAKPTPREYRPPPVSEGFEGMASVLKQVSTIDVDQEERMRALEKADKMRQLKLATRIDEFEQELVSFVGSKKLKKTGGAQEIERLQDEKNKQLLKSLFRSRQDKMQRNNEESAHSEEEQISEVQNKEEQNELEPEQNIQHEEHKEEI